MIDDGSILILQGMINRFTVTVGEVRMKGVSLPERGIAQLL